MFRRISCSLPKMISIVLAALWLAGCTTATPGTATPQPTLAPSSTPLPTATLTPTPALPVLAGTPVPLPVEPITPQNADQIQELAIWGKGLPRQVAFAISPDLTIFLPVDEIIQAWDIKTGQIIRSFERHSSEITHIALSNNGTTLASSEKWGDLSVRIWDVATDRHWKTSEEPLGGVSHLALSPDGKRLAVSNASTIIGLYDTQTGRMLYQLLAGSDSILRFSQNGQELASAGWNTAFPARKPIMIWNVETGELLHTHTLNRGQRAGAVFSSDLTMMVDWDQEGRIWVWNIENGQVLHTLKGHTQNVLCASFSPDNHILVSGAEDKSTRLWNVQAGSLLHTLDAFSLQVAFSPDGKFLLLGLQDGTIALWGILPDN